MHGGIGDDETKTPDCSFVRVAPFGCRINSSFCVSTDGAEGLAYSKVRLGFDGDSRHLAEVGLDREGRSPHEREREIRVRAWSAAVDQAGLWRQLRFLDQRLTGKSG